MRRLLVGGRSTIGAARFWCYLRRNFSSKSAVEPVAAGAPPWLMLPSGWVEDDSDGDNYHLFSVSEKKVTKIKKNFGIPWRRYNFYPEGDTLCFGSSGYGWQALGNKRSGKFLLFNPLGNPLKFSHTIIPLPPLESVYTCFSSFHSQKIISTTPKTEFLDVDSVYNIIGNDSPKSQEYIFTGGISKLVLSLPPLTTTTAYNEDSLLMAKTEICGPSRFVWCRPGDTSWTSLKSSVSESLAHDFTYFSNHQLFYSLTIHGVLQSWDPLRNMQRVVYDCFPPLTQPTMDKRQIQLRLGPGCHSYRLVDSFGDLLMVVRSYNIEYVECNGEKKKKESSFAFDVYNFDFVNKKWVYVPHLGDDLVLFLDLNSFSVSLSDNPGLQGSLTGNCIYFSFGKDVFNNSMYHDSGIYNLNDGSITTFLPECFSSQKNQIQSSPPMWIHPQH